MIEFNIDQLREFLSNLQNSQFLQKIENVMLKHLFTFNTTPTSIFKIHHSKGSEDNLTL